MKLSDCCGAPFYEPGFPDNDICTECKEHADAIDDRYIHKSVGTIGAKHYPDWDMKNKKYITYRKGIIND